VLGEDLSSMCMLKSPVQKKLDDLGSRQERRSEKSCMKEGRELEGGR
jgi:hypothetical protein